MNHDPLDPGQGDIEAMGRAAVDLVARYFGSLRERPIAPDTTSAALAGALDRALPAEGVPFERLLAEIDGVIVPGSRHNGHPRFFGYVAAPGTAATAMADLVASAINSNVTSWRSAPAATEVEKLAIGWIAEILGYVPGAAGLFVSGGSMANYCGLAAARHRAVPDVERTGMAGAPLTVYVSTEGHHSIDKAAALLGIGRDNVRHVATDAAGRIDCAAAARAIDADRAAGHRPFCIVANAGSVSTGAFDDLVAVAALAREQGLWMHVDGAYGGFAALAPSARPLFAGIDQADSVALDPHKWLYVPVDCGCVLYRDGTDARAAFSLDAEYVRVAGYEAAESHAFWDLGPELSRRFRALKVWAMLRHAGTRALGEAVERNLACARHVAERVAQGDDLEMLAPVGLSIFCFRYVPPSLRGRSDAGAERELSALNERIMVALQHGGSSYLSNALVGGRFALRGCIVNFRTTPADIDILLDDVRRAGRALSA